MITLADAIAPFKPAIALHTIVSRRAMYRIRVSGTLIGIAGVIGGIITLVEPHFIADTTGIASPTRLFAGLGFLGLAIWIDSFLGICYHNWYYFKGLTQFSNRKHSQPPAPITYDLAEAALVAPTDITRSFLTSSLGQSAALRSGLTLPAIETYLTSDRSMIDADSIILNEASTMSLIGLVTYLLAHDETLSHFLRSEGVTTESFVGALRWMVSLQHTSKRNQMWWSFENLSKTTGIGRELSFGVPHYLEQFARSITTSAVFSTLGSNGTYAAEQVTKIEHILASQKASNVLIVGAAGVGKMDLVMEVKRRIRTGQAIGSLQGEHIYVLDTTRLFAVHKDKQSFEQTVLLMLDEATQAGKVIIVIENLSTIIAEAEALGVFLPDILDPYLATQHLHFIATDTPEQYHNQLETRGGLVRRFTEVLIDTPDNQAVSNILEKIVLREEIKHNVLVTYPALLAIVEASDRYLTEGVMPDKAVSFLLSVISKARSEGVSIITPHVVYQAVTDRTGMPAGPVTDKERDSLLHLEDNLHQLVIGQRAAINAVASTMRRARVQIQSGQKPIGSFLFLGPTGVGKTETAKALAETFFGGVSHLQRLDMSEYSGDDAVSKLIGTANSTGSLSNVLREHPYSVILLDEFEKADQSVHDIFLQLLDEGMFTDGRGQEINGRNAIIIATSNAGSRLILETLQSRTELSSLNDEIVQHIIQDGIYRPELVNRFDNTIIFEPLDRSEQIEIAQLQLRRLAERVRKRGYELTIDDTLTSFVVTHGYSSEFGARPMQRVIEQVVEETIAKEIIAGSIQTGDTITLSAEQLESCHKT